VCVRKNQRDETNRRMWFRSTQAFEEMTGAGPGGGKMKKNVDLELISRVTGERKGGGKDGIP